MGGCGGGGRGRPINTKSPRPGRERGACQTRSCAADKVPAHPTFLWRCGGRGYASGLSCDPPSLGACICTMCNARCDVHLVRQCFRRTDSLGADGGTCRIEASSTSYAGFGGSDGTHWVYCCMFGPHAPAMCLGRRAFLPYFNLYEEKLERKGGDWRCHRSRQTDVQMYIPRTYKDNTFLCVIRYIKQESPAALASCSFHNPCAVICPSLTERPRQECTSRILLLSLPSPAPPSTDLFLAGPLKRFHLIAPFKRPATSDRLSWGIRVWLVAHGVTPLPLRFLVPTLNNAHVVTGAPQGR